MVNFNGHCHVFFNVFSKSTPDIPHTHSEHLYTNQVTNDHIVQIHRALGEFIHSRFTRRWNSMYPASIPSWHALVCLLRLVWTLGMYITVCKCSKITDREWEIGVSCTWTAGSCGSRLSPCTASPSLQGSHSTMWLPCTEPEILHHSGLHINLSLYFICHTVKILLAVSQWQNLQWDTASTAWLTVFMAELDCIGLFDINISSNVAALAVPKWP